MQDEITEKLPQTALTEPAITATTGRQWVLRSPVQIALILALGLGLYLHTLHAPFILDDYYCIKENPAVRDFAYLLDFDKVRDLAIWVDIKNNMAQRTVTYWSFALNYHFGGFNEFGYHLINICIHLLNAALVYLLVYATLQRAPRSCTSRRATHLAGYSPLLVALLFVAHPLQTQAVTYITQRFTLLVTLFYLGALLLYSTARTARTSAARWFCYGLALLTTMVAMKTQESAFTLPAMLLLYDLLFLDGPWQQRLLGLTPFFLTMLIIPVTVFRLAAADGAANPLAGANRSINLANFSGVSQWDYLITQFGALVTYLRLLLLPIGQNLIPDYPLAHSFFEPRIVGAFLLLLLLFGGAVRVVVHAYRTRQRSAGLLIAFGILWFFVTIAMSSSIIPLDTALLEYRVYLPSIGIFFAVVMAATVAINRGWLPNRVFWSAAVLIVILLSVSTVARNNLYNDKVQLLTDTLAKNPRALTARVGLAATLLDKNRFAEAIVELNQILEAIPGDTYMIVNLGYALAKTGHNQEAVRQYLRALALDPGNPFAHGNLGISYRQQGQLDLAERELRMALTTDPHLGFARQELATLYEEQGRVAEAIEQYRQLLQSYPGEPAVSSRLQQLLSAVPVP